MTAWVTGPGCALGTGCRFPCNPGGSQNRFLEFFLRHLWEGTMSGPRAKARRARQQPRESRVVVVSVPLEPCPPPGPAGTADGPKLILGPSLQWAKPARYPGSGASAAEVPTPLGVTWDNSPASSGSARTLGAGGHGAFPGTAPGLAQTVAP